MKYTERYFKFPIRVYDRFSMERAEKQEELTESPTEGEWREGMTAVPFEEITAWNDYFDSAQGPEGVDNEGFTTTIVWTKTQGCFMCTLPRPELEKRMDVYYEKWEAWRNEETKRLIAQYAATGVSPNDL